MCTKNGAPFLADQLKSIAQQSHTDWALFVSDDGSDDDTREILERFAGRQKQNVVVRSGPGRGACANFLSLAADPTIGADYFAFSDQDDIWHPEKLERALIWLATVRDDVPALHCGRTELMTAEGRVYGLSPLFKRAPAFKNALVQSLAGGNTIVFNRATKKLIEQMGTLDVVLHDWWTYQLVSAAGGTIRYDPTPMVKYRQHSQSQIGSNLGWRARLNSDSDDAARPFSRMERNEYHGAQKNSWAGYAACGSYRLGKFYEGEGGSIFTGASEVFV